MFRLRPQCDIVPPDLCAQPCLYLRDGRVNVVRPEHLPSPGGDGKGCHLLDYRLRCGHRQLLRHGLGDGGVKEEEDIVIFIVIVRGDDQWGQRGNTVGAVDHCS